MDDSSAVVTMYPIKSACEHVWGAHGGHGDFFSSPSWYQCARCQQITTVSPEYAKVTFDTWNEAIMTPRSVVDDVAAEYAAVENDLALADKIGQLLFHLIEGYREWSLAVDNMLEAIHHFTVTHQVS